MITNRAYSLLTIDAKSFDDEQRVFRGVASTPRPDRANDVVEPLGAVYSLPMPLLLDHDSRSAVGHVEFAKPTKAGIPFTARIVKFDEPGEVKDLVDKAWHLVKTRLRSAVSIGFRVLDGGAERLKDGGTKFNSWEWLELSLVVIPMNEDAVIFARGLDASIETIKSIDAPLLAAVGQGQLRISPTRPGAAGDRKPVKQLESGKMKKSLAEQISAFEATRQAKAARMQEIMDDAGEKGETLDTAQTEEYDGLQDELKSIDEHLVRMHALAKANMAAARPVDGSNAQAGADSRSGGGVHVTSMKRALPPGIAFARYVKCLIAARGIPASALAIAEHQYPDMGDLHLVLRAAVSAGTTTDVGWAAGLAQYQDLASEFIEFLRPATIIGKFGTNGIPALRAIPFNVRVPRQTSGGDAYWVGEGQPKPLTSFDFDTITLRWAKVANIAVITEELARFSSPAAEAMVRDSLRDALVARIDLTFVDPNVTAIADTRPASITNGRTPVTASGTDSAAVRVDVQELFGKFIANNLSPASGVWIMNATSGLALSMMRNALDQPEFVGLTMNGGTFFGLPVITTQHMAAAGSPATSNIVLVNASDIYLSDDGQVMIDASREASLQMDDAPTNASSSGSPVAPTATTMVSMFQTNSIAIRAERYINWARRRDAAVEYISGASYAA